MHRFVIVGGGAGGLELATRLGNKYGSNGAKTKGRSRAQVTLIDRKSTHLWKPLLHEVASGSIDSYAHEIEYPAQALRNGFEFMHGAMSSMDRKTRRVSVGPLLDHDGQEVLPPRDLQYDTLVLCVGSTTNYYGVEGAQENCFALDNVDQAVSFHTRLIAACTRANFQIDRESTSANRGESRVRIAIIGGGATGVELAAELRNTIETLQVYGLKKLDPLRDIEIVIIEAAPRILPGLSQRLSDATADLLGKRNIKLMTDHAVSSIDDRRIHLADGKTIIADLIVWSAGIRAPAVLANLDGIATTPHGQIVVGQTLRTEADENVFAFGDCAACPWPGHERGVPPRAQAAHQQAIFLARSLELRLNGKPLPVYKYRDFGSLVSFGHYSAVGSLMGRLIGKDMFVEGIIARYMYASLYRMHVACVTGISPHGI
ncbi:NADH dehydrogenase [Paraburkholderia sp. GAS199]